MDNNKYDEYFQNIENNIEKLKLLRNKYLKQEISSITYENEVENLFDQFEESFIGLKHSYLPINMPKNLLLTEKIPLWLNLNENSKKEYLNLINELKNNQESLIRKFRRPHIRKLNLEKAANLLQHEQLRTYNSYLWKSFNIFSEDFINQNKINIKLTNNSSNKLIEEINSYIIENELELPTNVETLEFFLLDLFGEDGPLEKGIINIYIFEEISIIINVLSNFIKTFSKIDLINFILPFITDLHIEIILENSNNIPLILLNSFKDVMNYIGTEGSLEDFGLNGVIDPKILELSLSLNNFDSIDNLINNFQKLAIEIIKISQNYKQASLYLAYCLISIQSIEIPSLFYNSIKWGSYDSILKFTFCPLYLMAFQEICELIPNFEE